MEPLNEAMKRAMPVNFKERYEQLKQTILEEPRVRSFLLANRAELTEQSIDRGLGKLQEFLEQSNTCCGASSTGACTNMMNGMIPELYVIRGTIDLRYKPCAQRKLEDDRRAVSERIASMHMPKDVLKATLKDLTFDHSRIEVFERVTDFAKAASEGAMPTKGFYIYGKFGVGKSFVLGALANELARLGIQTVMVFVPEFLRELKTAIGDNTLQQKIEFVKKAPVLMLDDLGAESLTAWTRDEILATILHYRMSEELPTFITSNFNYKALEEHLTQTQKGDHEPIKAARIMERIRAMTEPVEMMGNNRRV